MGSCPLHIKRAERAGSRIDVGGRGNIPRVYCWSVDMEHDDVFYLFLGHKTRRRVVGGVREERNL